MGLSKEKIEEIKKAMLKIPCSIPQYLWVGSQESADAIGLPGPGEWYLNKETNEYELLGEEHSDDA